MRSVENLMTKVNYLLSSGCAAQTHMLKLICRVNLKGTQINNHFWHEFRFTQVEVKQKLALFFLLLSVLLLQT